MVAFVGADVVVAGLPLGADVVFEPTGIDVLPGTFVGAEVLFGWAVTVFVGGEVLGE